MNPIIEKVARAICTQAERDWDKLEYMDPQQWEYEDQAKVAIRATLEHLRVNVSDEMELAGLKAGNYVNDGEAMKSEFRAMIKQAIAELDA